VVPEGDCRKLPSAGAKVRGALAGNGGEMAETQKGSQKPNSKTKRKTSSKTSRKTSGKTSRKASNATKTKECLPANPVKTEDVDGAELLRRALDKRLAKDSERLAGVLTGKALHGDLASTKMLVGLAEGKRLQTEPVTDPRGPSLAELLTAEPKWGGGLKEKEDVKAEG